MRWLFGNDTAGWERGIAWTGVLMVLFGLIVMIFPQILVALIATFFIGVGIMLIQFARNMDVLRNRL